MAVQEERWCHSGGQWEVPQAHRGRRVLGTRQSAAARALTDRAARCGGTAARGTAAAAPPGQGMRKVEARQQAS
jgi:hypothetical protein